jgi:NAD(P)-dependent dehydrogenase (short-subunit alcohol dehydrogenase family)
MKVLITGANRGLGLEFARQYAARGDAIYAAVREPSKAPPELARISRQVLALDATDPASIRDLAESLKNKPIDLLINNAGVSSKEVNLTDLSLAEMVRVLTTNTIGPAIILGALLPNLRSGKRRLVVNITSVLGSIAGASPGFSYAYCASKAALNMVTAKAAKELDADGISVVSICPGWNRTDMGGPSAPLAPADGVASVIKVIDRLTPRDTGRYLSHQGEPYQW